MGDEGLDPHGVNVALQPTELIARVRCAANGSLDVSGCKCRGSVEERLLCDPVRIETDSSLHRSSRAETIAPLRDQFVDHFAAELAELLESAGVVVGQTVVVEAQQVQQRDMDVTDMVNTLDG